MTSSDSKGKGKAPDLSSASASSTAAAPAQMISNNTPSRQDEQLTPSLFNRVGASAAGLGRDVFAGSVGVGGVRLRRDAQGLLASVGNGKGGASMSASGNANGNRNGNAGYTQMHAGNSGFLDGSSSISGGNGNALGMRSSRITGTSDIQGTGGSGDLNGNGVGAGERARWIQQSESEFSEFLDGVPSLTPAGDSGFEAGHMGSFNGLHTNNLQAMQEDQFQYGVLPAPTGVSSNPVGNQAFEDSWSQAAREIDNQHSAHSGPRAVNTQGPVVYHLEPLPAWNPDNLTAAEFRQKAMDTVTHEKSEYMDSYYQGSSVQEQESRDGDEVRNLLSRIGEASFDDEITGMSQGLSETEIEGDEMKAYEGEWMGMSSVERDRIIQVTRDFFPEEVKDKGGVVHGGIDAENPLNLLPLYEREAEERWRGERERERQRKEDDDDEFEGEVLNFRGIEWRVRKEKKNGETKRGGKGQGTGKQQWKSDWEGVLKGYTDEVWGGLLPLVREAREEFKTEEEKSDGDKEGGNEKGNLKALRRLGSVLGHLRGLNIQ
ncbi:hypothetical protein BOTCAL_0062g00150 [Botryotinia calthae]|uniref:Uncharacterized protein n=1 Tax=Botryotinia calthae TaxID=38488 RepID=A0A4Y8DA70_9HELO|nr:hypothetical protein BOTCAL_0062g00150 [Botryotinia calthae]